MLVTASLFLVLAATEPGTEPADLSQSPAPRAEPAAGPVAPAAAPNVETGSRIQRADLATAVPLTVITRADLTASGRATLGEVLRLLPLQTNSTSAAINSYRAGTTRLNLHGLGANRTLVLLDGRRLVSGGNGADSTADLDSIPTAIVERVEVLSAGASTLYGSDAIGGVVNIITRRDSQATELQALAGTSQHIDGSRYGVDFVSAHGVDRGRYLVSLGYVDEGQVMASDRAFSRYALTGNALTGERRLGSGNTPESRFSISRSQAGQVVPGATDLYNALMTSCTEADRTLCPTSFIRDPSLPLGWRPYRGNALPQDGGDGYDFQPSVYLVAPQQRLSFFADGDLDLGAARAFAGASYGYRSTRQQRAPYVLATQGSGLTVSPESYYNPFGVPITSINRRLVELGPQVNEQTGHDLGVWAGLRGEVLERVGWELSADYGRDQSTQTFRGYLTDSAALYPGVGPSFAPYGTAVCGTGPQPIEGCLPIDLLGDPGSLTPQMASALSSLVAQGGTNELLAAHASATGELFRLGPADPARFAAGYDFRRVAGQIDRDPVYTSLAATDGSYSGHELFLEVVVPIMKDLPAVDALEVSASARLVEYSSFGGAWTYGAGGRWSVLPGLALRGSYGTSFRAPSILDLYLGETPDYTHTVDPCSVVSPAPGCKPSDINYDDRRRIRFAPMAGNPHVSPESARVATVGLAFQPALLEGLTLTLDYYDARVADVVSFVGAQEILDRCYIGGSTEYCKLIDRDPTTSYITAIHNIPQNAGTDRTGALDLGLRYQGRLPVGQLRLAFDATYLTTFERTRPDGSVEQFKGLYGPEAGLGGYPSLRFDAVLGWAHRGMLVALRGHYSSSLDECADAGGDFTSGWQCLNGPTYRRSAGAYATFDLFASYGLRSGLGSTTVGIAVNNVLDTAPPKLYGGEGNSDPVSYDFLGRSVLARLEHAL